MELQAAIKKKLAPFTLEVRLHLSSQQPVLGLMGPSGSGKTTVLKCLAGLLPMDEGRIELGGRLLADTATGFSLLPRQRRCGYLFPNLALFPNLTVADNIRCGLSSLGLPRREREQEVAQLLRRLRLEGLGERYPASLSWGERQRLALARLLGSRPRLLLLDEPFSGLDEVLRREVGRELAALLAATAALAIIVSHRREDLLPLCHKLLRLEQGRVTEVEECRRSTGF